MKRFFILFSRSLYNPRCLLDTEQALITVCYGNRLPDAFSALRYTQKGTEIPTICFTFIGQYCLRNKTQVAGEGGGSVHESYSYCSKADYSLITQVEVFYSSYKTFIFSFHFYRVTLTL